MSGELLGHDLLDHLDVSLTADDASLDIRLVLAVKHVLLVGGRHSQVSKAGDHRCAGITIEAVVREMDPRVAEATVVEDKQRGPRREHSGDERDPERNRGSESRYCSYEEPGADKRAPSVEVQPEGLEPTQVAIMIQAPHCQPVAC
jgi:hypothetical protein